MSVIGRILPGDLLRTPYGDLLLVIAAVTRDNVVTTILLHTRSSRTINIPDTFRVPWLHRVEP